MCLYARSVHVCVWVSCVSLFMSLHACCVAHASACISVSMFVSACISVCVYASACILCCSCCCVHVPMSCPCMHICVSIFMPLHACLYVHAHASACVSCVQAPSLAHKRAPRAPTAVGAHVWPCGGLCPRVLMVGARYSPPGIRKHETPFIRKKFLE